MTNKAPVMLLFFNRPQNLERVFAAVKQYEPEELFLVQDGARNGNPNDIEKIYQCRKIVENIDWKCRVYRNYSEINLSCDHREFTGISWCFQYVDRLIILEDDCLPTQSFFSLCEVCLEKYQYNSNIHSITGFNRIGQYASPYDYVFSMTSAGWGWATWKRVWNYVESYKELTILDDSEAIHYLDISVDKSIKDIYGDFIDYMKQTKEDNRKAEKITSWEKIVGFVLITNNMLTITPSNNMVKYIGISEDATHTPSDPRLIPHKIRNVLLQDAYELSGEINHPPFVIRDMRFEKISNRKMKYLPGIARLEAALLKVKRVGLCRTIRHYCKKFITID